MKKFFLIFALLLCSLFGFAQFDNYKTVGRNNVTQRDIVAFVHRFEDEITRASIDTTSNRALVTVWGDPKGKRIRKKDLIRREVCYDLESQKEIWSKKLNWDEALVKIGDFYMYQMPQSYMTDERTFRLNAETGEKMYKIGSNLYIPYVNYEKGYIICCRKYFGHLRKFPLKNISMQTNEVLWERKMDLSAGCEVEGKFNDSVLLLVASGIHSLNINDGTGWSYEMKTNKVESFVDYPYEYKYVVDCHSNLLVDSTSVTVASCEEIVKFDTEGNVIWRGELDPEKTGRSHLVKNKDYVVLINLGFAKARRKYKDSGRPYFAVFDAESGKNLCVHERQQNADYFLDAKFCEDTLFIISADKKEHFTVEKYLMPDGVALAKKTFNSTSTDKTGALYGFLDESIYVKNDSVLTPIVKADTNSIYVNCKRTIMKFNRKLTVMGNVEFMDCYELLREYNGIRYFGHDGKIMAVDANDTEIATFDFDSMYFSESKLFSIDGSALYEVDLKQVFASE